MKLRLTQMLRERQIEKPYAFLIKNGFKRHIALKLLKDDTDRIQFEHLEQLCRQLWCMPNELFVMDDKELQKAPLPPQHPMLALKARPDAPNILNKLRQLPLDKLNELNRLMEGKG